MRKLLLDMTRIEPKSLAIEAFCNNEDTIKALSMSKVAKYVKGCEDQGNVDERRNQDYSVDPRPESIS